MMGLAIQSNRWKHSMEHELGMLSKSIAQATAWQEKAAEDESQAKVFSDKALEEKIQSESMQSEAESLILKGQEDEIQAATLEKESEGLYVKASQEKQEAVGLLVEVAAEEAAAQKENMAQVAANTALVAKNTASVEADEAGTVLCQWIPIVDVVCDVVGSVVAVGLETQGVREASLVSEEYKSAMVLLQSHVESLTQEAEELESVSVGEGQEASLLEEQGGTLNQLAQEELTKGQAEEVAAKDELAQSLMDKDMGVEKETLAVSEEEESGQSWNESIQHGAKACGNALMMSMTSIVAFIFWLIRIGGYILGVGGRLVVEKMETGKGSWRYLKRRNVTQQGVFSRAMSHTIHHVLLFVLFFGWRGKDFLNLRNLKGIPAMGGIVLGFSWNLATVQVLCLHSLPKVYQMHHQQQETITAATTMGSLMWVAMYEYAKAMLVLLPFTIMEILLIWVNFGSWMFVPKVVDWAQKWWLWGLLWLVVTVIHYRCFVLSCCQEEDMFTCYHNSQMGRDSLSFQLLLNRSDEKDSRERDGVGGQVIGVIDYGSRGETSSSFVSSNSSNSSSNSSKSSRIMERDTIQFDEEVQTLFNENVKLDPYFLDEKSPADDISDTTKERDATIFNQEDLETKKKGFVALVAEDAACTHLMLVFEVLMASVMFALLNQSTHVAKELWPASKAILTTVYPHFHIMAVVIVVMSCSLLACACF
mmetsp:Transcript_6077/g.11518  ORF Transcript_6077/g.11518 Transcript_6077/m.11518 type:complete len:705 (-) Transcript_6077:196-2310(-)